MTGWLFILAMALALLVALWRFGHLDRGGLQFLGAALLLALAGYAWQGHPALAGSPHPPPEHRGLPDSEFARIRHDLLGRFNNADYWLNMAEAFERDGDTLGAAQLIEAGLRAHPNDPDLWVGLGNALVIHGGGMMNPAAQLAFDRAAALAPNHPGPKFFYGLALAQSGRLDEAEKVWRDLLATAPPNATMWRNAVEQRLQMIEQARAAAQSSPPSQGGEIPQ
jgi:cytochrome c-type biogenesis protein CcmH/NrfG